MESAGEAAPINPSDRAQPERRAEPQSGSQRCSTRFDLSGGTLRRHAGSRVSLLSHDAISDGFADEANVRARHRLLEGVCPVTPADVEDV